MNEQDYNDGSRVDQHVYELINAHLDGELDAAEQGELDVLLAGSEELRVLCDEIEAVTSLLDEAPVREPPSYLQSAIERQVSLPVISDGQEQKQGFFSSWLATNWLRTGFALACGVLLTVGVYEIGSGPISSQDAASMVGTVVSKSSENPGELLGSIQLDTDGVTGLVELRNRDDFYTLDVQMNSTGSSQVTVNFAGRGLEFESISRKQDRKDAVSVTNGSVSISGRGEQGYTLRLRRISGAAEVTPLELDFFANNRLIHEAELSVSR